MALKDILVGLDPSSAGESRLKPALNLARAHRAYIIACGVTGVNHGAPVNPGPALLVAPEVRTATREPASASLPISREAERAEQVEELFRADLRTYGIGGEWQLLFCDRPDDPVLVNIKPDIRDTIPQDPSPMHEARHRPIRRNPRYLHTVRRVPRPQADMWSSRFGSPPRSIDCDLSRHRLL
jgi:hypothetical protein